MNRQDAFFQYVYVFLLLVSVLLVVIVSGCKDAAVDPPNTEPATDREAMQKMVEEDSSITSFEPNYNDEGAVAFLGKTNADIYPFRIGTKVRVVQRSFTVDIVGDTAYGTYSKSFEGVLLIAASYDSAATSPDTLIQKPFTSVITRKIIFIRVGNSNRPMQNWRIAAISLPEGGTTLVPDNIDILKVTITLPDGNTFVIDSPNEYFLSRGPGWWHAIPVITFGQSVNVELELTSIYEEPDFVVLTYGAGRLGNTRAKKRFELISTAPGGLGYVRVYNQTFTALQLPGFFHAVITAFPKQTIYDDSASVELDVWGIPYAVRLN